MPHHQQSIPVPEHPDQEEYLRQLEEKLPPMVSPVRLARLLDMNRRRIYEMVETCQLAAVRHGKRGLRIYRQSVVDWLRRGGSLE